MLRLLSRPIGVQLWPDGLRSIVIRSSSSMTTSPSSTPLSGMFCLHRRWRRTVFDELCVCSGDWAGGVWSASGFPGQEQSCAARTGFATCEDFVRNNGRAFQDACESLLVYWRLNPWLMDVRLFQTGKSNRTSDTRRTRHDIHACPTSRSSHSLPLPLPFHCMPIPCHNALAQANDVMKFKPLYSLVHNPPESVSL